MTRSGAKHWWGVDLPKGVISLSRDHPGSDWVAHTTKQVIAKKIENQNVILHWKRATSTVVPCFVWVFYNNTFFYGGWYTYIKTLKEDYALNFRNTNEKIIEKIMQLFPCATLPAIQFFRQWMKNFAEQYHHDGFGGRKKQGLVQCWCLIDECGRLSDIFTSSKKEHFGGEKLENKNE